MKSRNYPYLNASVVAVLSISFLLMAGNAINTALALIAAYFPDASATTVRMVSTLPSILNMLVSLGLGTLIGKKISYKTTFFIGSILFLIGGLGPVFLHENLLLILAFRALFGCAIGCFNFANAYYLCTLNPEFHGKILGLSALVTNVGAAIMQLTTGFLADITWYYAFIPHVVGFITLFLLICLMEKDKIQDEDSMDVESTKEKVSPAIYKYVAAYFFVSLTSAPIMSGMGTLITGRGLGGNNVGTTVAIILTICQIGGVFVGVIFDAYIRWLRRFTIPGALLIQGLGIFIIYLAHSLGMVIVGVIFSGIGTILVMQLSTMYVGQSTPKSTIPMATTINMLMAQCAIFLSSYYIALCDWGLGRYFELDVESCYVVSVVLYGIVILITCFAKGKEKENE